MCGIVGLFDPQGNAGRFAEPLQRATDALRHRGPDDEGCYFDGAIALGFRRLSILDISPAGHQPMVSRSGDWVLVFNGEIYNYLELREQLRACGVEFKSSCDTEVCVEALAHWGTEALQRFNGMWALLAWHRPTSTLLACRDPWGIKPLFMGQGPDATVMFASEIKALRQIGCGMGGVDGVAARRFLDHGLLDTDQRTMFRQVTRLEPGVVYRFTPGRPVDRRAYPDGTATAQVPRFRDSARGEAEYIEAFRHVFLESVRLRLRADVDIGTCLSGGLDSTSIACAADHWLAKSGTQCRYAFTALFPEFDETRYVRAVIDHTGMQWHSTLCCDATVQDQAASFFRAHDEPVHSLSAFAGYLVMAMAAQTSVKVLLNGQGSDEILAGYPSTVLPYLRSVWHDDGLVTSLREAVAEGGSVTAGLRLLLQARGGSIARKWHGIVEPLLHVLPVQVSGRSTLVQRLVRRGGPLDAAEPLRTVSTERLQPVLDDQLRTAPLPLYLRVEDANSSAFSLESRLPFLDPAVIAMARAAPPRLLRRGGLNKVLLRRILPGLVPDIVWQRRDKMGFPVPHGRWLRGPLREMLTDTLAADRLHARGWYDAPEVGRLRDAFLGDPTLPLAPELLRVFLLERWARDQQLH